MSNYEKINVDEQEGMGSDVNEDLISSLYKEENNPVVSTKPSGVVRGYSAGSYSKDDKNNFDCITIATNIKVSSPDFKSMQSYYLPFINIFAVYDGYNGKTTSEKLRDKLYRLIVFDEEFLIRTEQSIISAFSKIDEEIRNEVRDSLQMEYSGSSALVCLTVNEVCYVAHLGLSKAFISNSHSERVRNLTKEHGNDERVREALSVSTKMKLGEMKTKRSVGNMHIKQAHAENDSLFNTPDILTFRLTQQEDFIVFLSDSIHDKLSNACILLIVYESLIEVIENALGLEYLYSFSVQRIFKAALQLNSQESLTCLILFFSNFTDLYISKNVDYVRSRIEFINNKQNNFEEFYNHPDNIIKMNFTYDNMSPISSYNNKNPVTDRNESSNGNNKNLIINNINNNISITKETKIYCCCFKRKKKIRTAHNVNNNLSSNIMI
jgi:protein phosphatase 2C family protein 2/3